MGEVQSADRLKRHAPGKRGGPEEQVEEVADDAGEIYLMRTVRAPSGPMPAPERNEKSDERRAPGKVR